jgi:flavin reductase (DIM6/NTAB) family NADH-FMN oxidoreductase RutF
VAHSSTTWPILRTANRLGISILAAEQHAVVRQLAARNVDRFAGLTWRATTQDAVLLDGASGWLEVSIQQEVRAGDHDIVVLTVHELEADQDIRPLVFHGSTFRRLER